MILFTYCMSKFKSELAGWIEDHTFPVMCAIAQLYLFENCDVSSHWRQEVWASFKDMRLLRRQNKLPTSKFIFENSWKINEGFVNDAVTWAIDHENTLHCQKDVDVNQLYDIMERYFKWLSDQLSKHKTISSTAVYTKLDELGLLD